MRMTDGSRTVEVSWDTSDNYGILAEIVEDYNLSSAEILDLFANEFGLQLFSEEHFESMLEELGFEKR